MSLLYRLLYRIGFTPWDTGQVPEELSALIEGPGALPRGRALDIGCGTGTHAVYMARAGWEVTAIDAVPRPLSQARARADAAGVSVDWILGDVARLHKLGLTPGFTLIFDRGCFHGLDESQRGAYAAAADGLAASGATLLMLAFAPSRIPTSPPGVEQSELVGRFAGWQLVSAEPEADGDGAGPLRNVPRSWYRLVRG
jgi:SAM-dependent methyltransferase